MITQDFTYEQDKREYRVTLNDMRCMCVAILRHFGYASFAMTDSGNGIISPIVEETEHLLRECRESSVAVRRMVQLYNSLRIA